tara:strand:+ start:326 stop:559 length:234 start_codon:yes stop_codon:yes gene_type:complete
MPKSPKISPELKKMMSLKTLSNNIVLIITVIITQIVLLFIGKYLWNKYLVDSVTFIKPLRSVLHLLAIIFLAKIIFN